MNPKEMKDSSKIFELIKQNLKNVKNHFSAPSPPEIFIGRFGYPNINIGILAPTTFDTKHDELNTAENWSKNNLSIQNIIRLRSQMIYARSKSSIKEDSKLKEVINELALTHKKTSTEFFLKKEPNINNIKYSNITTPLFNPAPIKKVNLEENTKILKKVDYLINDIDVKATESLLELSKFTTVDHMQKILSAGLLGKKTERKFVPTRWSITAVDDIISKSLIEKIKTFQEVNEIQLLEGNYLGNYLKILILPGKFNFEVIEIWGNEDNVIIEKDYEGFNGRKTYASNVTGGYYAIRLAVSEYLKNIKKQGVIIALREITNEYFVPLGVGIVRETTRRAVKDKPKNFESINQVLNYIILNKKLNYNLLENSYILTNYGKQKSLNEFI